MLLALACVAAERLATDPQPRRPSMRRSSINYPHPRADFASLLTLTGAQTTSAPAHTPTLTSSPSCLRPRPGSSSAPAGRSAPTSATATSGRKFPAQRATSSVSKQGVTGLLLSRMKLTTCAVGSGRQHWRPGDAVVGRQVEEHIPPRHLPPSKHRRLPRRPLLVSFYFPQGFPHRS